MTKKNRSEKINDLPNILDYIDIEKWAEEFANSDGRTLHQAARQIINEYKKAIPSSETDQIVDQLERLVTAELKASRMIAGFALEKGIVRYQWDERIIQWVYKLADDSEWDVREGGQLVLRAAMDYHFDSLLDILEVWIKDTSPNIRRAALMACRPKPRSNPDKAIKMWKIVGPLMSDNATYVYRNIPYVLGFWGYHPDVLLSSLLSLAESTDNITARKNIARILYEQRLEQCNPKKFNIILDILSSDHRPVIQKMVSQIKIRFI